MEDIRCHYEIGQLLNEEPTIYIFEDFLSDVEIHDLVEVGDRQLQRALVSVDTSGVVSQGRTGRNCWIPHHQTSAIHALSNRISELVNIPLVNAESFQLIHYFETQKYRAHYDAWEADTERGQRCMARGGQRLVTCLLYLNDVDAGGGTCFPKLDLEVAAKRGRMVIFHNCFAGTNLRHPDSLHGGMPVEAGEKWACNLWFREKSRQTKRSGSSTGSASEQSSRAERRLSGKKKQKASKQKAGKRSSAKSGKKRNGFG
ncbi:MAG: 2OG-Fe(II) oxygenase [Cyanobacteria bacterium J06623_4]